MRNALNLFLTMIVTSLTFAGRIMNRKIRWLPLIFSALILAPARAETVKIPWNGDYAHNGETVWSPESKFHKSGLTKNFTNGAPEEHGKVQRDGFLLAEIFLPKIEGPVPFMIIMHGCTGTKDPALKWSSRLEKVLTAQGYGVLVLDSFSTRNVASVCGDPNYHWAIRRVEDAYSALAYLIDNKLAKPDEVFAMDRSNGALTAIMASEDYEVHNHQYRFAGIFALSPTCIGLEKSTFATPVAIFTGDKDQAAVDPKYCESLNRPTGSPIKVIEFKGVYHGYEDLGAHSVFHGWRMEYNAKADNYTMATIYSLIKTKKFERGVEYR